MKKLLQNISRFFLLIWAFTFVQAFIIFYLNSLFGLSIGEKDLVADLVRSGLLGAAAHCVSYIAYMEFTLYEN